MYTQPVTTPFPHLDALLEELKSLRPLPDDVRRKLAEKLRLDWNYHSNALEGNTLTYGETKALILADRYIGNKEGRHYREISAHNDVVKALDGLVRDDVPLSEKLIKELHQMMLGQPYTYTEITPEGVEVTKRIVPGKYKTAANYTPRSTGERFYFSDPAEVSGRMGELILAFREFDENASIHPVALATWFHYEFIRIHPFDDGNGLLARILMNLILQRRGLVPAIIKVNEKTAYLDELVLVDATSELESFTNFIGQHVERIMDMEVRAAKGEDISEPEDWLKELKIIRGEIDKDHSILYYSSMKKEDLQKLVLDVYRIGEDIVKELMTIFDTVTKTVSENTLINNIESYSMDNFLKRLPTKTFANENTREIQFDYILNSEFAIKNRDLYLEFFITIRFERAEYSIIGDDFWREFKYTDKLSSEVVSELKVNIAQPLIKSLKKMLAE